MTTTLTPLAQLPGRYGARQVVKAEFSKLRTLRSTKWTLLITVVGTLLVTFLASNSVQPSHGHKLVGFDPTNQSLSGFALGSLAIGILGVLAITGEYGSGTIRSSLAAGPRRPLLLAAKAVVMAVIGLILGEVLTFACFFVGQNVMSGKVPTAALGDPGVLRALLLTGGYLALLGLLGLGLGFIIRHTAGAIAAFVGVIFLIPALLQPFSQHGNPARFAPEEILSNSVAAVVPEFHQLSPTVGFLLMIFYCAVTLGLAALFLNRRDA